MNVSYGPNTSDVLRGLKVILNRVPFGDRTNNFRMPVENKCDVNDMKTNQQNTKKITKSAKNVARYSKSSRNKNNCVIDESIKISCAPTREVLKDCRVILERIPVPEVDKACKVISEKPPKVLEVVKSCKVILEKTNDPELVKSCKFISERRNVPQICNIDEELRLSTPLVDRLRKCNEINYCESPSECSTVEPSKIEDKNTPAVKQKIPIYRQNIEESKENDEDPYKLDVFDLDEDKPKRARNLDNSRKFNKTMYDLLEKLNKKEKKVVKKKALTSNSVPKYNQKIKEVLKKVMNKVNDRKKVVTEVVQENQSKNPTASDNLTQRNGTIVTDHSEGFGNSDIRTKMVSIGEKNLSIPTAPHQGHSVDNVSDTSKVNLVQGNRTVVADHIEGFWNSVMKEPKEVPTFIESVNGYESERGFLGFNKTNSHLKTPTIAQPNKSINIISVVDLRPENSPLYSYDNQNGGDSENDCDDQYFGFDEDSGDDGVNFPNKIIESPAFFSHRRPNANSTMIGVARKSPWRLSVPGKRNNHFLLMKNNSLPSLNQDMVLDYSVTEESEQQVKSRCEEVERPKSPVQTSILDFIEGSTDHHSHKTQDHLRRSSLFDYEDFVITKPRRKILGVLQDNVLGRKQTESTPRKDLPNLIESPDMSAVGDVFYGFDTTIDKSKENKIHSGKPFRIDVRDIRKYKKNMQVEKGTELPITEETVLPVAEETVVERNELVEEQGHKEVDDCQIFGDFDSRQEIDESIKLPKFTYGRKRRRKRFLSCDEAGEPKKKKKDMMTKAELDAFEKWAEEFNSMCKEVDEHQLEID